jgi:tRNA A-37 threonylcarbamoyl transferase component Bud32/Leucine-rich repeat (LRR) protein
MAASSTASLLDALRRYRLLEPAQLEQVSRDPPTLFPDPRALARVLIGRGWLTPYQANKLLQGRGPELLLGSYVLLERLGEGGMGQVFKARNWKFGRVVAVKVIRKERLASAAAVRRFRREVRAVAALSHPNIVHAFDADEVDGTQLLVMEYVEGTDLKKLVQQRGPLPAGEACEYVRQAALGLQHAFERGVVHRDIKPHNLLLTADGSAVKILDMGLARLEQPSAGDGHSSTTQEGTVMGTADYIAPEQALESHTVDIRADLYSLGCTLYHLLAGRVPFPGGSFIQKVNRHQFEEPRPVDSLRPEVPPGVAAVVRRLMAKKPADRYQTPAEVAAALASAAVAGGPPAGGRRVPDGAGTPGDTVDSALAYMADGGVTEATDSPRRQRLRAEERRWLLGAAAGGGAALIVLVLVLGLLLRAVAGKKPPETVPAPAAVAPPPPPPPKKVDDAWIKEVAGMPAERQVEAVRAKLKELNPGFDGTVNRIIDDGAVTELRFTSDKVTDLSPVRGIPGLKRLNCSGTQPANGKLSDLSPLKGLSLEWLDCSRTQVADLAPLKGMPLQYLDCYITKVSDLSPLQGMPLWWLHCDGTGVRDLAPLRETKTLTGLMCIGTAVSDLSPLKDLPLRRLDVFQTQVTDFSPLVGMPLKELRGNFKPERDAEVLRSVKTLELINDKPAAEFWKEVDDKSREPKP